MTAPTFFRKQERLVSRRLIEQLFGGGSSHSMVAFPVRVVYQLCQRPQGEAPVQLLVSVSKRHFKHAVDRNRVKRQLREAYRLHKEVLSAVLPADRQLLMALVWLTPQHQPSATVHERVVRLLQRLAEKL